MVVMMLMLVVVNWLGQWHRRRLEPSVAASGRPDAERRGHLRADVVVADRRVVDGWLLVEVSRVAMVD